MTHYDVSYKGMDREEADRKALNDIAEYLGGVDKFVEIVEACKGETIQRINLWFAMGGISGYPFHAFCRKYHLAAYREWMHAEPDPVLTDENGYSINKEDE
jgi:hypothetical protein